MGVLRFTLLLHLFKMKPQIQEVCCRGTRGVFKYVVGIGMPFPSLLNGRPERDTHLNVRVRFRSSYMHKVGILELLQIHKDNLGEDTSEQSH
jgi:hypothetical protein